MLREHPLEIKAEAVHQWIEVMGTERMTGAMLDRLTHRVHIIEANGESYRLAESRRRQKRRRNRAPKN